MHYSRLITCEKLLWSVISLFRFHFPHASTSSEYVSLKQAAVRAGLSKWTLYHWIAQGRLTQARGLRRLGARCNIEWAVFKAAIDRGEFAGEMSGAFSILAPLAITALIRRSSILAGLPHMLHRLHWIAYRAL